jgi:hypothetical protein
VIAWARLDFARPPVTTAAAVALPRGMSPRTAIVLILLAACGSRSAPPPPPPSVAGSPAPPRAASWDPTADDGLQLARVTTAGVEPGATVAGVGDDRGWLDGHTLVGLTKLDSGGYVVARLIDGQRAADVTITPAEWPGLSAELLLGDGEIWLAGCEVENEFVDCVQSMYLRVAPGPRTTATQPPRGRRRYGYHGAHLLAAPTGPAPIGGSARVDVALVENSVDPETTMITCTRGAGATRLSLAELFDDPIQIAVFGFSAPEVRWLAITPPLLEVRYDYSNPAEVWREVRAVFRPCDDRPMADFRWLGDGVWAERHGAYDDPDVGWTFHRGDRTLGELPGIDLD